MNIIEANFKWNGKLTYGNTPKKIVLHHAEASSCTVADIHRWHLNNGWTGIGYHFFVKKDGTIYRGRPENVIGAHVSGANSNTLGICAEGSYMTETMPRVQKEAIKELIQYLDIKYGKLEIYGHREVGSSNCPGTNYPLEEIKARNGAVSTPSSSPNPSPSVDTVFEKAKTYNTPKCKELQEKLNKCGYDCGVTDGIYGVKTHNALGTMQEKNGLVKDYLAGSQTFSKLDDLIAKQSIQTTIVKDEWVLRLQRELNRQGYKDKNGNKLVEDGILGELTLSACPVLKKGAKGGVTALLQEKLVSLGYNTNGIDSIFGNGTHDAVVKYQAFKSLTQDGVVGQGTWRKILGL